MTKREKAIKQAEYCQMMLSSIIEELKSRDPGYAEHYHMTGNTVVQNDIVHLRRELLKISNIVASGRLGE